MAGHAEGAPRDLRWRDAAAQVLVDDLDAPALGDAELHHLSRVLRLRPGAVVCASDGAGGWRLCTFSGTSELEDRGVHGRHPAPRYPVAVGFALVKGDKPELVVQKLTELGVDRIVMFGARRSVVRWDAARAERHLQRARRVAREACAQSRRLWLPTVELAQLESLVGEGVAVAEAGGRPIGETDRMVLIGPEGGWERSELGGRETVALGSEVLRAETAAIAAGTLLCALRGGYACAASGE